MSITYRKRRCLVPVDNGLASRDYIATCITEHNRRTIVVDSLKGDLGPFYNAVKHWGIQCHLVNEYKVVKKVGKEKKASIQRSFSVSGPAEFLDKLKEVGCFLAFIYGEASDPDSPPRENHLTMRIDSRKL